MDHTFDAADSADSDSEANPTNAQDAGNRDAVNVSDGTTFDESQPLDVCADTCGAPADGSSDAAPDGGSNALDGGGDDSPADTSTQSDAPQTDDRTDGPEADSAPWTISDAAPTDTAAQSDAAAQTDASQTDDRTDGPEVDSAPCTVSNAAPDGGSNVIPHTRPIIEVNASIGATGVPIEAILEVQLTTALLETAINDATVYLTYSGENVPATIRADGNKLTIAPVLPLGLGLPYTLHIGSEVTTTDLANPVPAVDVPLTTVDGTWSEAFQVSSGVDMDSPSAVVDAFGNATLLWRQKSCVNCTIYSDLLVAEFRDGKFAAPRLAEHGCDNVESVKLGGDEAGTSYLTWLRGGKMWMAVHQADGVWRDRVEIPGLQDPFVVLTPNDPKIYVDPDGAFAVILASWHASWPATWAHVYDAGSATWSLVPVDAYAWTTSELTCAGKTCYSVGYHAVDYSANPLDSANSNIQTLTFSLDKYTVGGGSAGFSNVDCYVHNTCWETRYVTTGGGMAARFTEHYEHSAYTGFVSSFGASFLPDGTSLEPADFGVFDGAGRGMLVGPNRSSETRIQSNLDFVRGGPLYYRDYESGQSTAYRPLCPELGETDACSPWLLGSRWGHYYALVPSTSGTNSLSVARRTKGQVWGSKQLVVPASSYRNVGLTVGSRGHAMAVWVETDARGRGNVWARWFR